MATSCRCLTDSSGPGPSDHDDGHFTAVIDADAIDNPAAEFEVRVDNIEFVYGDRVDGDKVLGDKTIFEGSN